MTQRGKDHLGALCVTAASLAERAWTVMRRGTPYAICDTDGRPVTTAQAKAIIAAHWTVPPEIRARRRGKKTGKALRKSSQDNTHEATSPAAPLHPGANGPSNEALDNRSSIGNQNRVSMVASGIWFLPARGRVISSPGGPPKTASRSTAEVSASR
jgi:hypothetical protein